MTLSEFREMSRRYLRGDQSITSDMMQEAKRATWHEAAEDAAAYMDRIKKLREDIRC